MIAFEFFPGAKKFMCGEGKHGSFDDFKDKT